MKLATLPIPNPQKPWDKDGQLCIVDDDANQVYRVPMDLVPGMFAALQDWTQFEPQLRALDAKLKAGELDTEPLDTSKLLAPLPRCTSWVDGSAFIQHIILVRKARNAEPPEDLKTVPLMYQGCADPLLAPTQTIECADEAYGIDFEAEVAVVLDEVPMGVTPEEALDSIRLFCTLNDVSLRGLIPRELKAGFGFFHGKPPSALSPFFVTADELGDAWKDGRIHLDMEVHLNGKQVGNPNAGAMFFHFGELIAHAAKTRPLPAGTIVGSGTISNEDEARGICCLAEKRMLEIIHTGEATTPFMRFGDKVHIDMKKDGKSVFGAIEQTVVKYER